MKEYEKREALENIELIKELVIQTKKHMGLYGGGWIPLIWGIFCLIGVSGQRLFFPQGPPAGLWWTILAGIALFASYLVVKKSLKSHPQKRRRQGMRWFFLFWIPLIILAYVLTFFIVFIPELSRLYIPVAILLVISTGYLIIGSLFFRGILAMGIIGFVGSIVTAIFFLEYADIILGLLFGLGLITTGLVINLRWKNI